MDIVGDGGSLNLVGYCTSSLTSVRYCHGSMYLQYTKKKSLHWLQRPLPPHLSATTPSLPAIAEPPCSLRPLLLQPWVLEREHLHLSLLYYMRTDWHPARAAIVGISPITSPSTRGLLSPVVLLRTE
jgi:hypothetical protein